MGSKDRRALRRSLILLTRNRRICHRPNLAIIYRQNYMLLPRSFTSFTSSTLPQLYLKSTIERSINWCKVKNWIEFQKLYITDLSIFSNISRSLNIFLTLMYLIANSNRWFSKIESSKPYKQLSCNLSLHSCLSTTLRGLKIENPSQLYSSWFTNPRC